VQFAEPPALSYRGRPGGPAATRPAEGQKFDPQSAHVRHYTRTLLDRHDRVLQSVDAYDNKLYSYRYTFNGFAARLTAIQVQKIRSRKDVLNVWEDRVRYLYTNDSAVFLGLHDATAGLTAAKNLTGENIVIGVIDSGIAPEHPSFADTVEAEKPSLCRSTWAESSLLGMWLCHRFKKREDQIVYEPLTGWNGICETGENFTADACGNKIIGARYYVDGFLQTYAEMDSNEFMSPRDADGHGTHIASTAAGTEVRATLAGTEVDRIVGIAPRARIAVYKACWLEPGRIRGSCSTSDLQRAIEDAVADGVDIINYSVGNTDISISDPDDLALLAASNAGVLSVVAAGNDGPFKGTILSPSGAPWVLTVGASSRTGDKFDDIVRVNSPNDVAGDMVAKEATFTPTLRDNGPVTETLVLVNDADTTEGTTYDACSPLVNTDAVAGKIAFLQRGGPEVCTFEVKLRHVENAGAVAAIVFNHGGEFIIMTGTRDSVGIPAVMIGQGDGQRLFSALQNGDTVDVTLNKNLILAVPETGNVLASFSSRGPNLTAPDILKPDVIAPGVNILAGQTPDVANGIRDEQFQYLSGTSMSTPQVAGIAALIKQAHPDWSPAMIKSALVTTGRQDIVREDGETPTDPFDIGGGHVVPNRAVEPGLVYEANKEDYEAFLCGLNNNVIDDAACEQLVAAGHPTEATDLNLPSIAVSALVSAKTVRRQVTNVGDAAQFNVEVDAPPGIDVEVNPSVLSLGSGETGIYDVTLSTVSADLQEWQFGSLSWVSPQHKVRSPIAVRPDLFAAPFDVIGSGIGGGLQFDVHFGYTGSYTATVDGLAAPQILKGTVTGDARQTYEQIPLNGTLPPTIWRSPPNMIVTNETDTYFRVALYDENTTGDDDLDLYVYYCPTLLLCDPPLYSGNFDSNEQVNIRLPKVGNYIVDVHGFDTEGAATDFDLFVWTVGATDNLGNLAITAPTQATGGEQGTVTVTWDGLSTHQDELELKAHLGTITHDDGNPDAVLPLEITVIEIRH
jgi:subtilisin family serine protease